MADIAQVGFDYAVLSTDTRREVEAATRRLHTLERRTSEAVIEIGKELISVKKDIGHGNFLPWLEAEFGWSKDTAERFVNVAKRFADNPQIAEFAAPSALYALASPSTPEDVRDGFAELASLGQPVTHKDVKEAIKSRKPSQPIPVDDWHPEAVDVDTGEILDDIPFEIVDPSDPASFLAPLPTTPSPRRTTLEPEHQDAATVAAEGLIRRMGRAGALAVATAIFEMTGATT